MEFRCLGPLTVVDDGRELDLGSLKQRVVLAHLLIRANEAVSTDRLIADVWHGAPPSSVRNSLHSYVSRLRKAVGADRIESRGAGYVLRVAPDEVDRIHFEALLTEGRRLRSDDHEAASATLRAALALWRGPAFADLGENPGLDAETTRLEQLRVTAVEERIAADLERGLDAALVPELEALTTDHPLRERLWGQLMLALYRSGRQAEALETFRRLRTILADELAIDPSVQLRTLNERILRQDPALHPGTRSLKSYRLLERIFDGPAWTTWRALPPGGGGEVVIAAADADVANQPGFVRHFDARAQQVAGVKHPHVLPLYDFWREPDGAYLVHPLVAGGDHGNGLRRVLGQPERMDVEHRLRIADQLLQGLAAAHRRGVAHGRIDPSTVVLDEDNHAYLTGFAMDGAPKGPTRTAPERFEGGPADARSDVYATGVLLSHLLADATASVRALLRRATASNPAERPEDATVLLAELREAVRSTDTVPSFPESAALASPAGMHEEGSEPPRNPFKGLRAFGEADARDFHGRESFVARLLARMREDGPGCRFLAVVGPSGTGKSSLVGAGLLPALRSGALPTSDTWYIVTMRPGNQPFEQLAAALRQVAVDPPDAFGGRVEEVGLSNAVAELLPDDGEVLVVVDQFEELFTLADGDVRRRFIDALVAAVTGRDERLRVVVTIRADFYDRPLQHRGLGKLMQMRAETVAAMTAAELMRAVTAPAERVGVPIEPSVAGEMVADVADEAGALPLLQYALTELFDTRDADGLSLAAYRRIGGVAGAVGRRADGVFAGLSDAEQAATRQLFLRLVTPGENASDTRRRVPAGRLTALAPDHMPRVLTAFGDARLLSFDRDPDTREPTVEVAHEALLRQWPRLRWWIEGAREDLHTQRRLAAAAEDWVAADRDPSFLATGSRLQQYDGWRASSGMVPTARETAYLDASLQHRDQQLAENEARTRRERAVEQRSVRRLRTLVGVLAAAVVVGAALTVFATSQAGRAADQAEEAARHADIAAARELAAASVANLEVDPERSMLLALAAVDRTRAADGSVLPEVEEALHRAVTASRIDVHVPGIGGRLDWSRTADEFVTEGPEESGLVDIRSGSTGQTVRSWRGHDIDVNDVAYSPDGSLVLTAGDDGALRAWDAASGAEVSAYATTTAQVWGPSASPDNSLMAAVWPQQGIVRVVDVASGALQNEISLEFPAATAFSPDGTRLAVNRDFSPGGLVIIDLASGDQTHLGDSGEPVYGWGWSPDGRWLAAGTPGSTVHLYDTRTGEKRDTFFTDSGAIRGLAWSADATRVATAGADGTAKVWQVADGQARELVALSSAGTVAGVGDVAFSPGGERLVTGDILVESATVWDLGVSGDAEWLNIVSSEASVRAVAFLPAGRQIVVAGRDATATLWNIRSGARVRSYGPGSAPARGVAVSQDGAHVGALTDDGRLEVWDAATGKLAWAFEPEDPPILGGDVGSHPYLVAAWDEAGVVRVFDRSGRQVETFEEPGRRVTAVAFHPSGRRLAVGTSPAGRQVTGRDRISIYDIDSREMVQRLEIDRFIGLDGLSFDAAGRRLAVSQAGVVDIWNLGRELVETTLVGHSGRVLDTAFSPDGTELATVGNDATVRIWDTATGIQQLALPGHEAVTTTVAYSPDGSWLVSAGADGVVRVWATDVDDLVAMAEAELTRDFTEEECRQYLHADTCESTDR